MPFLIVNNKCSVGGSGLRKKTPMNYTLTIIITAVVIIVYLICAAYVKTKKDDGDLEKKRRWIEQLPSLVSTCGVLGTFLGITIGLIGFDTKDIAGSIPTLLGGLSTAFFTSLAGMIGSLLLSRQVNGYYDEIEKGVSDATSAASLVVNAIQTLVGEYQKQSVEQGAFFDNVTNRIGDVEKSIFQLQANQVGRNQVYTLLNNIQETQGLIQKGLVDEILPSIKRTKENIEAISVIIPQLNSSTNIIQSNIKEVAKIVPDVQRINANLGELMDIEGTIPTTMDKISDKVTKLTDKLHSEVVEIEDAMDKTNNLLELKFHEFTELLKKSNTEALVEVMKKVTEEFQKQMGELINKLVQENFDQLNKSVEQLNTWQIENKDMIASLTKQYKQMADNFDATSETLTKVGGDTRLLVSDGGKLRQIIDALNKVLIEDTKFIEVSSKLAETADLTKDNMQKFDESTKSLNDWVRKQRNFVDGVTLLINKLDEINKINDYSEEFWKETKKGLNEAIGTIRSSINALNNEIGELDEHFYQRLNATLSELDTCMQAMIQERR